jgi:hypothetical protein
LGVEPLCIDPKAYVPESRPTRLLAIFELFAFESRSDVIAHGLDCEPGFESDPVGEM